MNDRVTAKSPTTFTSNSFLISEIGKELQGPIQGQPGVVHQTEQLPIRLLSDV